MSCFSFYVSNAKNEKDYITDDPFRFRITVGIGKEKENDSIGLYEDNIGSHIPDINKVMKLLGITCEDMENEFSGERNGKTNNDIKNILISQGWYEDKELNYNEMGI